MPGQSQAAAEVRNSRVTQFNPLVLQRQAVEFGRNVCGDLSAAEQREWVLTNGIGGFASGTVAGLATRRYHGLLIAALKPPLGRTLLVSKFLELAEYEGRIYPLS